MGDLETILQNDPHPTLNNINLHRCKDDTTTDEAISEPKFEATNLTSEKNAFIASRQV